MDDMHKTKQSRCRFANLDGLPVRVEDIKFICTRNGLANDKVIHNITEEQCEQCPHFKSKFIEYPITVSKIDVKVDDTSLRKEDIGKLVRIRPCGKEYNDKTYVGVFLGDLPISPLVSHNETNGVLSVSPLMNPAIFVPDLKKIIYGCESWWKIVEDPEELDREITDKTIQNQWYVQALKEMAKKDKD